MPFLCLHWYQHSQWQFCDSNPCGRTAQWTGALQALRSIAQLCRSPPEPFSGLKFWGLLFTNGYAPWLGSLSCILGGMGAVTAWWNSYWIVRSSFSKKQKKHPAPSWNERTNVGKWRKRSYSLCAQLAAARTEISSMTPHEARSAKGSSFHIILSQFKRALGCAASRIAAETKLRRTFLIRPTKQGADIAARSAASNHYNRFSGHSPHWFHSSENEDAFNDFYTYKHTHQNFYDDSFDSESEREE